MRRLALLLGLAVSALACAPIAGASVTIGSTRSPYGVAIKQSGSQTCIHFISSELQVKTWCARVNSLSVADGNTLYGHYMPNEIWDTARSCPNFSRTDDTAMHPAGISDEVMTRDHMMLTLACESDAHANKVEVQVWQQQEPDFGTALTATVPWTVNVSVLRYRGFPPVADPNPTNPTVNTDFFDLPTVGHVGFAGYPDLLAATRWSKFSPGGYQGYLKGKHFQTLYGSFTYGGAGVWGPGDRGGNPTNQFGRNIYIDTFNSDFGDGWRRVVGVLSQQPNGSYCYEFSPKGGANGGSRGKTGAGTTYTVTAQGPGIAPDMRRYFTPPDFTFGNDVYNAKVDKWGTNFSDGEAQALRNQALQMGPDFRRKVKGTDCAQQLRQLPDSFFAPPAS